MRRTKKVTSVSARNFESEGVSNNLESTAPLGFGDLDLEQGVVLRDWSAQDFANIYVRFRPHLYRQAFNFLRDEHQAEEIVQDAFLYLMTSLPELDSELGVLKFLKWKIKMLCLDSRKAASASVQTHDFQKYDFQIDHSEPVDQLIRADDAAIVQLALAKLSPRHLRVLTESVIMERPNSDVASDLGLSENATRQLIYRAKSSFKTALVEETQAAGLSISQLLGIASAKIKALGVEKVASLILMIGMASSFFLASGLAPLDGPNLGQEASSSQLQGLGEVNVREIPQSSPPRATEDLSQDALARTVTERNPAEDLEDREPNSTFGGVDSENRGTSPDSRRSGATTELDNAREFSEPNVGMVGMDEAFGSETVATLASLARSAKTISGTFFDAQVQLVSVSSGNGLSAHLVVGLEGEVSSAWFTLALEGNEFAAVPLTSHSRVDITEAGMMLEYAATDLRIGDLSGAFSGVTAEDNPFSRSVLVATVIFSQDGQVSAGDLKLIQRS